MRDNQGDNQGNETEHTFKVGDKVKVVAPHKPSHNGMARSSIEPEMHNSWADTMDNYDGEVTTVQSRNGTGYRLNNLPFNWLPEWLELVARAEEPYAPGTKVELIKPAPGLNIPSTGTTRTIKKYLDKIEDGKNRYTVVEEDDFIFHSTCFKPLTSGQQEDVMKESVDGNNIAQDGVTVGDTIHLKKDIEVDRTPFSEDETLTVVAVHDDIGHVVFQDEDGLVGITRLDNVKEGVGPSMNEPYEFEGVVEFEGCFDLDDEVEINTTSAFDEAYNLVTGKEYKVSVRIEEKD